jgi:hypothetical protein
MAKRGRTLIIGDVHSCRAELEALVAKVAFTPKVDHLIFVGDLLVRGPDPRGTLAVARALGATIVRGNHEQKLLAGRAGTTRLGPDHRRVADILSSEDWRLLESLPLWVDLEAHGARVVHAGVVPGMAIGRVPAQALLRMRTVDEEGRWSDERDAGPLWGALYKGPPHVLFGHNARSEPQLHPWATGLDTGCVYGRRLTGMLLDAGEPIPRGQAVRSKLVSVPAQRAYYGEGASKRA